MILFDLTAVQPLTKDTLKSGGGKYAEIILHRMVDREIDFCCYYDSTRYIDPYILNLVESNGARVYDIRNSTLAEIIKMSGSKVLFSALPSAALEHIENIKIIGTTHGLRRLELPADKYCFKYKNIRKAEIAFYFLKKYFPNILRNRLKEKMLKLWGKKNYQIITVSNHTAHSIKVYFPECANMEIPVFYSPSTSEFNTSDKKFEERYFMMVSGNRLEKNNLRAIMAFDMLFSNHLLKGYKVYVTGASDASNYRYKIKNPSCFTFLGYVSEKELDQLYHDAYALVYPSLNEGFGYPPLEAMHYGVPVLSSSFTSIAEVCGGASMFFNPFDVDEIANRIIQIVDTNLHKLYSDRSRSQFNTIKSKQDKDLDGLIDYINAAGQ